MHVTWCTLILCVSLLLQPICAQTADQWTNIKIHRTIDLRSHIEEQLITIDGTYDGTQPSNQYTVIIPAPKSMHLSLVESYITDNNNKHNKLDVAEINDTSIFQSVDMNGAELYSVTLPRTYNKGDTITFNVHTVYTRTIQAYPETIEHGDNQLVLYTDSVIFYSPYRPS